MVDSLLAGLPEQVEWVDAEIVDAAPLLDLPGLLDSWCRQLRGQRKSAQTLRSYRLGVESFLRWCDDTGQPRALTKVNVTEWVNAQYEQSTATVRLRLTAVKLFVRWLADEEGFDPDPITAVKSPKLTQATVSGLTDTEISGLLKACAGARLRDKRDKAMVAVLTDTGLRAAELLGLDAGDIDLDDCVLQVRHGKGDKPRRVAFSPSTAAVVDRYVRARRTAVHWPTEGPLWISERGNRLCYTGLVSALKGRAAAAGIIGFHVHRLRHSMATRWLRAGGSETGLRSHAGWTDSTMIGRYVAAAHEQLAVEEFSRLNLGIRDL
jgi:integrase/recombinase XerD